MGKIAETLEGLAGRLSPFALRKDKPRLRFVPDTTTSSNNTKESLDMSFLATFGKDVKGLFAWLGSAKGQATVTAVEGVAVGVAGAVGPGASAALAGGFTLLNNWMTEALTVEGLATAAGQQTGTGPQKAAVALSTMTPQLAAYLNNKGYTSANVSAKALTINNLIVQLLNTLEAPDGVAQAQNDATPVQTQVIPPVPAV